MQKKEEKIYLQNKKTTFPKGLLYQHTEDGEPVGIIHADQQVFPSWILEVERRIEALERKLEQSVHKGK